MSFPIEDGDRVERRHCGVLGTGKERTAWKLNTMWGKDIHVRSNLLAISRRSVAGLQKFLSADRVPLINCIVNSASYRCFNHILVYFEANCKLASCCPDMSVTTKGNSIFNLPLDRRFGRTVIKITARNTVAMSLKPVPSVLRIEGWMR